MIVTEHREGFIAGYNVGLELWREMQSYGDADLVIQIERAIEDRDVMRMFAVREELKRRKEATNDATH